MDRWDELANLKAAGLPVKPVDPEALPGPVRGILPDWAQRRHQLIEEARKAAESK